MRRILSGVIKHPPFGQTVLSAALTFSRLVFCFRGNEDARTPVGCTPCRIVPQGWSVEFRLMYRGELPAQGSGGGRLREKHAIRKAIHKQLAVQWRENPVLSFWLVKNITHGNSDTGQISTLSRADEIAKRYAKHGYNWLPLVTEELGIACSLDILFLRRDAPGKIIQSGGGDIDNRIKVLFDALRMPKYANEVEGYTCEEGENPFFCLLEDDSLINEVKITTDRLLTPLESGEAVNDVVLVIHVRTIVVNSQKAYIEFYT
jgi:hypothetical protein